MFHLLTHCTSSSKLFKNLKITLPEGSLSSPHHDALQLQKIFFPRKLLFAIEYMLIFAFINVASYRDITGFNCS